MLRVDDSGDFLIEVAQTDDSLKQHSDELDPVVLALMQNRLDQISRHMGWVMTRTAEAQSLAKVTTSVVS